MLHSLFKIDSIWVAAIEYLLSSGLAQGHRAEETPNYTPLEPGMMASQSLNVFKQPLKLFSRDPVTGYFRDGYCRTGAGADPGSHAVAGVVTDEFLDYSASRGNDLRAGLGLRGGCRWCLCTARWAEAHRAYRGGRVSALGVPRVDLDATEDSALATVDLRTLREFAVREPEGGGGAA